MRLQPPYHYSTSPIFHLIPRDYAVGSIFIQALCMWQDIAAWIRQKSGYWTSPRRERKGGVVNAAPRCLALLITQYSGKDLTLRIRAKSSAVLNLIMESILCASPKVSLFRDQNMKTVQFVDSTLAEFKITLVGGYLFCWNVNVNVPLHT